VAIAGVLLFHTGLLPGGFLGVDLFFVLSGYLITNLLIRELQRTGRVSLVAFWGRRARRLMPALVTVLAVVTVAVRVAGPADLVRTTLADGPWVQADLVNWHLIAQSVGYWDRFGPGRVFEHLWSIAVEEQFYLVWPVVVTLAARARFRWRGWGRDSGGVRTERRTRRRAERRIGAVAVAVSVASLAAMVLLLDPADTTRVYFGTDTRAFSLLLGGAAATGPARSALAPIANGRPGPVAACLVAVVGAAWLLVEGVDPTWLYTGGLFAHSLACAVLIGLCVLAPATGVARALALRPLRWLGSVSYGLYLWHWPVIVLLSSGPALPRGPARTVAVCALSLALATLSKRLIEDPIRFRASWARGAGGAAALAVAMIGLAVLWTAVPAPAAPTVDITELR